MSADQYEHPIGPSPQHTEDDSDAAPINDLDKDAVVRWCCPSWWFEHHPPTLGTADQAKRLRSHNAVGGSCSTVEDGPYSDGRNPEYWSRHIDGDGPRGVRVRVVHTVRLLDRSTVVRKGRMTWNEIANRATVKALTERGEEYEPVEGEQLTMNV